MSLTERSSGWSASTLPPRQLDDVRVAAGKVRGCHWILVIRERGSSAGAFAKAGCGGVAVLGVQVVIFPSASLTFSSIVRLHRATRCGSRRPAGFTKGAGLRSHAARAA